VIKRIAAGIAGVTLLVIGGVDIVQILTGNGVSALKELFLSQDVVHASILNIPFDIKGPRLAALICLMPVLLSMAGIWLCRQAIGRREE